MSDFDEQGRPEPPVDGDELATLVGFLEFHRATLAWKTDGLAAEQLNQTTARSSMTLGGLLKHISYVEQEWFNHVLLGRDRTEPWASVDWLSDIDWDWHSAGQDSPEQLRALWRSSVERSRRDLAEALESGDLGQLARRPPWRDGRTPTLRWILTHMIEEYSRHNGHADLIREAIDGQVGE
jgi:uncharacterized damage-inducible protein DinB